MYHDDGVLECAVTVRSTRKEFRISEAQLSSTIDFLLNRDTLLYRVAVQFPDDMLDVVVDAIGILQAAVENDERYNRLLVAGKPGLSMSIFALTDSTFGSCCPDEITAMHYQAECIIHFGKACMNRSCRIPVVYVHDSFSFVHSMQGSGVECLPYLLLDVAKRLEDKAAEAVCETGLPVSRELVIVCAYEAKEALIAARDLNKCKGVLQHVVWCEFESNTMTPTENNSTEPCSWCSNGVRYPFFSGAVQHFLFVGPSQSSGHELALEGVIQYNLRHYSEDQMALHEALCERMSICVVMNETFVPEDAFAPSVAGSATSLPPMTMQLAHELTERWLPSNDILWSATGKATEYHRRMRQRQFNIETVRRSSAIGILVVSLAIQGYYDVTMMLHSLVRLSKKRSYIIYVGHLNEFKVANFVDTVDCFVAVACPNSRESYYPQKSDGFLKPVVSPVEALIALSTAEDDTDASLYSLPAAFVNSLDLLLQPLQRAINAKKSGEDQSNNEVSGQLVQTGNANTVGFSLAGTALERLYERSYVGLDNTDDTPVQTSIHTGKSGVARAYDNE